MQHPGAVPDYTRAFLWSALMVLFMGLMAIWAIFGFATAVVLSWAAERAMVLKVRRVRVGGHDPQAGHPGDRAR